MSKVGKRSRCHVHEVSGQAPKLRNVAPEIREGGANRCRHPVESDGQEAEQFAQNSEGDGDVEVKLRQPGAVDPHMTLPERPAYIVETLDVVRAVVHRGVHSFIGLAATILAVVLTWRPCVGPSGKGVVEDYPAELCVVNLFAGSPVASGFAVLEKHVFDSPSIESEKAVDLVAHPGESNLMHFRCVRHKPIHELREPLCSPGLKLSTSASDGVMESREPALFEVWAVRVAKESLGQIPQCRWECASVLVKRKSLESIFDVYRSRSGGNERQLKNFSGLTGIKAGVVELEGFGEKRKRPGKPAFRESKCAHLCYVS